MMRGVLIDGSDGMAGLFAHARQVGDPDITLHDQAEIAAADLPALLAGYQFLVNDHTTLPTEMLRHCPDLRHVIFLGTGASSFMDVGALADLGITVHTIGGYGDRAVAEHAIALMWSAARGIARMDREMRAGVWLRTEGVQLGGRTLGLIGFGGIAAEVARIANGCGMRVIAWNRTPRTAEGVAFLPLDQLLAESAVVSLHLSLTAETRSFLNADRLARMRPDAILVNTARAALVDSTALIARLRSGVLAHAALDVFDQEPLPPDAALLDLPNVTLTAHSGFCTPDATRALVREALAIARRIA